MGYESLKLSKNHDFAKGVEMWPKATQLKDVIVQAPDIYATVAHLFRLWPRRLSYLSLLR